MPQMAGKGTSKTIKREIDIHEVTGMSQGQYEVTGISHSALCIEPVVKVQG